MKHVSLHPRHPMQGHHQLTGRPATSLSSSMLPMTRISSPSSDAQMGIGVPQNLAETESKQQGTQC